METSSVVHAILTLFVLAYLFSAWTFMAKQKLGASFISSFDKAIESGAWFFALGSGLSFIAVTYSSVPPVFI